LKPEEGKRLTDQETLNLIFESDSAPLTEVTEVSGRGIGGCRSKVLDASGNRSRFFEKGRGTQIQLRAPLTLASIQDVLFRVGGRLFAVPLSSVVEIHAHYGPRVHRIDQREVLRLRDPILLSVRLEHLSVCAASTPSRFERNISSSSLALPKSVWPARG